MSRDTSYLLERVQSLTMQTLTCIGYFLQADGTCKPENLEQVMSDLYEIHEAVNRVICSVLPSVDPAILSSPMSDATLAKAQSATEKTTRPPWTLENEEGELILGVFRHRIRRSLRDASSVTIVEGVDEETTKADAWMLTEAPLLIQDLVTEVRRQRALLRLPQSQE